MRILNSMLMAILLVACASYAGRGLKVGESSIDDVMRIMGTPAMQWKDPDGARQLAYPRGIHTFMVDIGPDGKMMKIENIMKMKTFKRVKSDMTKPEVLRILGPSFSPGTAYYKARDELVWEWRYCDDWNEASRFEVMFDASKEIVRKTMSFTDSQLGLCGMDGPCRCGNAQ